MRAAYATGDHTYPSVAKLSEYMRLLLSGLLLVRPLARKCLFLGSTLQDA